MALAGMRRIFHRKVTSYMPRSVQTSSWTSFIMLRRTCVQWVYRTSPLYIISLLGYKFSILLLYLRLFGVSTRFRYCTWAVMFLVFGYLFSNLMTQFFSCRPIIKYWNSQIPGHCIIPINAAFSYGTMNFASDFFIALLPLPMVWRLKMSRRQKIGVMLVFMGGAM